MDFGLSLVLRPRQSWHFGGRVLRNPPKVVELRGYLSYPYGVCWNPKVLVKEILIPDSISLNWVTTPTSGWGIHGPWVHGSDRGQEPPWSLKRKGVTPYPRASGGSSGESQRDSQVSPEGGYPKPPKGVWESILGMDSRTPGGGPGRVQGTLPISQICRIWLMAGDTPSPGGARGIP